MFTRRRPVAPELDLLTAKLAALMPFGKAAAFLAELLPMQAGTNASTVRNRTRHVGKRLERRARRQDQAAAADRAAARHDAAPPRALMIEPGPAVVTPAGPEAVLSLDGAYLRSRHPRPEKTFEVVVAKVRQPEGRVSHVAFAGTESLGAERVRRLVRGAHLKEGTSLIALSDGAANLRALQRQGAPRALHLLDWFHLAMRFERLLTAARALPDPEPNSPVDMRAWSEDLVRRAKWALWHGQSRKTRGHLEDLCGWTQAKQNSLAASGVTAGVHAVVERLGRELLDYLWVTLPRAE